MTIAIAAPLADTWGMHGGDVGWGWMGLWMVIFWGAIIFGVVWLARGGGRGWSMPRQDLHVAKESPVEILERRFAEGAISVEDYHARRQVLLNGSASNGTPKEEPLTAGPAGGGGT